VIFWLVEKRASHYYHRLQHARRGNASLRCAGVLAAEGRATNLAGNTILMIYENLPVQE
jgi:hypothetical protein